MATGLTDRLAPVILDGMKMPVRAATTANITLSGEQTVDTVAVVTGDRVLVKDQTDPVENGLYTASTGGWVRTEDFNGARDAVSGVAVTVAEGGQALSIWGLATTGTITPGTTSLSFSQLNVSVSVQADSWSGTTSGSQTDLSCPGMAATNVDQYVVSLSGVTQRPTTDFTLDFGNELITLDQAAPDGIVWLVQQMSG